MQVVLEVLVLRVLVLLWHPSLRRTITVCTPLKSKRHHRQPTATAAVAVAAAAAASHQQTAMVIAGHGQEARSTPFQWTMSVFVVAAVAVLRHHHSQMACTTMQIQSPLAMHRMQNLTCFPMPLIPTVQRTHPCTIQRCTIVTIPADR